MRIEKGGSLSLRAAAKYEENKSILLKNNKLNKIKATDLLPLVAVTPVNFGNSETKNYAIGVSLLGILPIAKKIVNVIKSPIITPKKLQNAVIEISFYKDSLLSEQIFSKQIPVSENAAYDWEVLKDSLIFEESGFIRVTLRNSNTLPVLFDNLELRTYGTQKARIIQENHYEPFGMTLQGLDYVAENTRGNNYLYQGKEKESDLGLEMYDFHARNYDPQVCRTNQLDPHVDTYQGLSPYSWVANNPMGLIDSTGKDWGIGVTKNKDGSIHVNITFTGTVRDETGKYDKKQLKAFAERIQTAMTNAFAGSSKNEKGQEVTWSIDAKISVSEKESDVSKKDHVFRIVEDGNVPETKGGKGFGYAAYGKKYIYLNEKILNNGSESNPINPTTGLTADGQPTLERTASHEVGHTAYLMHPEDHYSTQNSNVQITQQVFDSQHNGLNLMYESRKKNAPVPKAGTQTILQQVRVMQYYYTNGQLNKPVQKYEK